MVAIKTTPKQNVRNLASFFNKRKTRIIYLNAKLKDVQMKFQKELKEYKEKILFSLYFTETIIFLKEQLKDNLYKNLNYPKSGLFLRKIEIAHIEYIGDFEPNYCNNIIIQFKFDKEDFNGYISLNNLGFNHEEKTITEQVMGIGFDLNFATEEKYLEAKNFLQIARDEINENIK